MYKITRDNLVSQKIPATPWRTSWARRGYISRRLTDKDLVLIPYTPHGKPIYTTNCRGRACQMFYVEIPNWKSTIYVKREYWAIPIECI
jgi:hypothetical protein